MAADETGGGSCKGILYNWNGHERHRGEMPGNKKPPRKAVHVFKDADSFQVIAAGISIGVASFHLSELFSICHKS